MFLSLTGVVPWLLFPDAVCLFTFVLVFFPLPEKSVCVVPPACPLRWRDYAHAMLVASG